MTIETVTALNRAASRAADAGWFELHRRYTTPAELGARFDAWCAAEDFTSHPSGLGVYLRRKHTTPTDVAAGLRRAAKETEQ